MGMYSEFYFSVMLKYDLPIEVFKILSFMSDGMERVLEIPNHPFFKCDRWKSLFLMRSAYFPSANTNKFYINKYKQNILEVHSSLKNYDGEIDKFLNWIRIYVELNYVYEFVGLERYEENQFPTLIFFTENEIYYKPILKNELLLIKKGF